MQAVVLEMTKLLVAPPWDYREAEEADLPVVLRSQACASQVPLTTLKMTSRSKALLEPEAAPA